MQITPQLLEQFQTLRSLTLKAICLSAEAIGIPLAKWDRKYYPEEVNSIVDNLRAHVQNSQHVVVLEEPQEESSAHPARSAFDTAPTVLQGLAEIEKFLRPLTKATEGKELRSSAQLQASQNLAVLSIGEATGGSLARAQAAIDLIYEGKDSGNVLEVHSQL